MNVEHRLKRWREAEDAAIEAERAVDALGNGAQDPHTADLCRRAHALRQEANRQFSDLLRAIPLDWRPDK